MDFYVAKYDSPVGMLKIVACKDYITNIVFLKENKDDITGYLTKYLAKNILFHGENELTLQAKAELEDYFAGKRKMFDIPIKYFGTHFQNMAWDSLCKIPYGQVKTYKQQAESVGAPKAYRAIGQANHNNPISIVVPCHRVVGTNNKLVGFAGGIEIKKYLLALEVQYMDCL